jgi:hypothetical protein
VWRKSSYSGFDGDCVEIATLARGRRAVRDSTNPTGTILTILASVHHRTTNQGPPPSPVTLSRGPL